MGAMKTSGIDFLVLQKGNIKFMIQRKETSTLTIGIIIVLVIAIGLGVFIYFNKTQDPQRDTFQAVPTDAFCLVHSYHFSDGLNRILETSIIWDKISQIPKFRDFHRNIAYLDSLGQNNAFVRDIFEKKPVLFSLHQIGQDRIGWIGYVGLPDAGMEEQITEKIRNLLGDQGSIVERDYTHTVIYDIQFSEASGAELTLSFAVHDGIFLMSSSSILLEDAIRQLNLKSGLVNNSSFSKVAKTAGTGSEANVYLNYRNMPSFFKTFVNSDKHIQNSDKIGNWTELDLSVRSDAFLLNGLTYADDSGSYYLSVLEGQSAREFGLNKIIPSSTAAFVALGINNFDDYLSRYKRYLNQNEKTQEYQRRMQSFEDTYNLKAEKFFRSFFNGEVAKVYTHFKNYSQEENTFLILRTKGKSLAKETFMEAIRSYAQAEEKKASDFKETHTLDGSTFTIYTFPDMTVFSSIFGHVFSRKEGRRFIFVDNYLVFGNSVKALKSFKYKYILGKTFENSLRYKNADSYLSAKSNVYAYMNLSDGHQFLSGYLRNSLFSFYESNKDELSKVRNTFLQIHSTGNEMYYTNLFVKYQSRIAENTRTEWESVLDTTMRDDFKPVFVKNHNTGDNEVFVQDAANTVYLISKNGRILWKKPITEKINSQVYQLDYYKNNNLQMLFSTRNFMHLIDRNGNYVERYPVQFRSPATNGISLFDYANTKNYRIFVSGKNKQVYNYDKTGNLVEGWEFKKADNRISTRIQHFRVNTKDYIVFADKNRLYILNRRGKVRVPLKKHFAKSRHNKFYLDMKSQRPRLVTTDTSGSVRYVYFDGSVKEHTFRSFSPSHQFLYNDLDADGKKDYIFMDRKTMRVYNHNREPLFDYTFEHAINYAPHHFVFSANDKRVGITDGQADQIYLFKGNGKLSPHFPVEGSTPFSINKFEETSNNFNIIVGSSHNFLYNYTL